LKAEEQKAPKDSKQIARVRRLCNELPETFEKLSHGEPTFFVRKKVFAMFSNNHHDDGHVAVLLPAAIGIQAKLIEASPEKFYRPAYVGVRGWVGIELSQITDEELRLHIREAWKLIAPQKLQDTFQPSTSDAGEPAIEYDEDVFVIPSAPRMKKSRGRTAVKARATSGVRRGR
jgi:hypothetical protein